MELIVLALLITVETLKIWLVTEGLSLELDVKKEMWEFMLLAPKADTQQPEKLLICTVDIVYYVMKTQMCTCARVCVLDNKFCCRNKWAIHRRFISLIQRHCLFICFVFHSFKASHLHPSPTSFTTNPSLFLLSLCDAWTLSPSVPLSAFLVSAEDSSPRSEHKEKK